MAVIGNTYITLADLFKRQDPNHQIAQIIELLAQTNPILQDMVVKPCNDGTTHLTTVRTGIPEGTWRKLYQGVQPSKSTTKQVRDATGFLENWSEVDAKLVDLSKDKAGLRLTEATAFIEGMSQTAASALFYGDQSTDPERITGLAPRFSALNAENGKQIIDAGGTGADNASIWFVVWGDRTVHGLYPDGSQAGLQREDKGKVTKTLPDGSVYDVYREKFQWDLGLSVRDWRYVARVANIKVPDLKVDASTGAKLFNSMISAYWRLHQRKITGGKAAIYCNSTVMEYLDHQSRNANSNVHLTWREAGPDSEPVLHFRNMPIRETDALLNTEARVV
jgi:hypothetical protein